MQKRSKLFVLSLIKNSFEISLVNLLKIQGLHLKLLRKTIASKVSTTKKTFVLINLTFNVQRNTKLILKSLFNILVKAQIAIIKTQLHSHVINSLLENAMSL